MSFELRRHNQRFGALTVVGSSERSAGTLYWTCVCKCGEYRRVEEKRLVAKQIATCLKCEVKNKMANLENEKI